MKVYNEISDVLQNVHVLNFYGSINFNFNARFCDLRNNIDITNGKLFMPDKKENIINNNYLKDITNNNFDTFISREKAQDVLFYTDGSVDPVLCRAGLGVFCPSFYINMKLRLNDLSTICNAKALAIIRALNIISEKIIERSTIVTDSLSVLRALMGDDRKGNLDASLYSIKLLIYNLKKRNLKVDFLWIPSHCGIKGNERADSLAGQALVLGLISFKMVQYTNLTSLFRKTMKLDAINYIYV